MKSTVVGLLLFSGSLFMPGPLEAGVAALAEPCEWTMGIPTELVEPGTVVFGEMHGTKEAPYILLSAICTALTARPEQELVAALEYPIAEAEHLQNYLGSDGSREAKRQFMSTRFWQRDMQDGRTSAAMFHLIDALRVLRSETQRVLVFPFVPRAGSGEHEQRMAEILDRSIQQRPNAQHVVLVGNVHARKAIGRRSDPEFRSMVRRMNNEVLSVAISATRGDYWACTRKGCGRIDYGSEEHDTFGSLPLLQPVLKPHRHYDRLLIMDRFTASPPASDRVPTAPEG